MNQGSNNDNNNNDSPIMCGFNQHYVSHEPVCQEDCVNAGTFPEFNCMEDAVGCFCNPGFYNFGHAICVQEQFCDSKNILIR